MSPVFMWNYVAVLDGFCLICNIKMLEKVGGFDERSYPLHHMYDNDICLESIRAGYKNIVIDMDVDHHGGMTDVGEDWAAPFGKTKDQVHKEAHPPFYQKWRGVLPYRVGWR
jgi:GT2 family glycosyltransferase